MGNSYLVVCPQLAVNALLNAETVCTKVHQFYLTVWQIVDLNLLAYRKVANTYLLRRGLKRGIASGVIDTQNIPIVKTQISGYHVKGRNTGFPFIIDKTQQPFKSVHTDMFTRH